MTSLKCPWQTSYDCAEVQLNDLEGWVLSCCMSSSPCPCVGFCLTVCVLQTLVLSDEAQGLLASDSGRDNGDSDAESWCTHVEAQELRTDSGHGDAAAQPSSGVSHVVDVTGLTRCLSTQHDRAAIRLGQPPAWCLPCSHGGCLQWRPCLQMLCAALLGPAALLHNAHSIRLPYCSRKAHCPPLQCLTSLLEEAALWTHQPRNFLAGCSSPPSFLACLTCSPSHVHTPDMERA